MTNRERFLLIFLWVDFLVFLGLFIFAISGCSSPSYIKIGPGILSTEPNGMAEAGGKAADTIAESIAKNLRTPAGLRAELQKYNPQLYLACIGMFIVGVLWWGFTKSRYGWLIPAAAVGGLALLFFSTSDLAHRWLPVLLIVGLAGLFAWKAVEYHAERNEEIEKGQEK